MQPTGKLLNGKRIIMKTKASPQKAEVGGAGSKHTEMQDEEDS